MAGADGFEPPNDDTKNRCLTTWLRPNLLLNLYQQTSHQSIGVFT